MTSRRAFFSRRIGGVAGGVAGGVGLARLTPPPVHSDAAALEQLRADFAKFVAEFPKTIHLQIDGRKLAEGLAIRRQGV
jgi:hypothetical protein